MMSKLIELMAKPRRRVVGLMSGTSVDGIDAVLVELAGSGADIGHQILAFDTVTMSDGLRCEVWNW